jgi:hypothetical protein
MQAFEGGFYIKKYENIKPGAFGQPKFENNQCQ